MAAPLSLARFKWPLVVAVTLGLLGAAVEWWRRPAPIRVGLLHSRTGTLASSETPVMEATLLAIDELNARGGVNGRRIEPIIGDGRSEEMGFTSEAHRLIERQGARALFGCWSSVCRKSIKPIVERAKVPLFYPLQYEGFEVSPYIVYCGATPNQQILPAVDWAVAHLGRRVFLVGSDYIFPRVANELIRDHLALLHGSVVGEEYLPLGARDVQAVVKKIADAKPDLLFSTINGDTNVAFFKALRAANVTSLATPTVSFSFAEAELRQMGAGEVVGDYAAWNYFESLEGERNASFVQRFKQRYGAARVTDDPMEAGYFSVYLWAQAVESGGTEEADGMLAALRAQFFQAPEGLVYVDPVNLHVWKSPRVGQIQADGQFRVVWSDRPTRAVTYPLGRSEAEWDAFIHGLYGKWGNSWSGPVAR